MQKVAGIFVAVVLAASSAVLAQTTQKVIKIETSVSVNGKTGCTGINYISHDGKMRTESSCLGGYNLQDFAQNISYMVNASTKTALKITGGNMEGNGTEHMPPGMTMQQTPLGKQIIEGFSCEGFASSAQMGTMSLSSKTWQCTDPQSGAKFVGQSETTRGTTVSETKITKVAHDVEVPSSYFEVPSDYKVTTLSKPAPVRVP